MIDFRGKIAKTTKHDQMSSFEILRTNEKAVVFDEEFKNDLGFEIGQR